MLERPDTLLAAFVCNLLRFLKPVVSSRIVVRMNLVHLSVGRAWTQNTLIQIYMLYLPILLLVVMLVMVFHPPTVSWISYIPYVYELIT
jgi:hypothetical protein